jgi:tungstate transport system permease protein
MGWQIIIGGLSQAFKLIFSLDKTVIEITLRSLHIATLATILAAIVCIPISVLITMKEFRGKNGLKFFFNAMVGIPTVTLGLFLYSLFSKSGPLATLSLLYTVKGIAVGQALLISPIMITFIVSAIESKDEELRDLVRTLGASEYQTSLAVVREAYSGVSLAIVSSFNRAFAELGIAIMLGANIKGVTRVLTTAIALETSKGDLGLSFALSFILLFVVLALNYIIARFQGGVAK